MSANDRQVGGSHYATGGYQHWDFADDAKLRYLPGQVTKYLARWRKKNGRQDLEKAIHFLDKCIECLTPAPKWIEAIGTPPQPSPLERFLNESDLTRHEKEAITATVMGDYSRAKALIVGHLLPCVPVLEVGQTA